MSRRSGADELGNGGDLAVGLAVGRVAFDSDQQPFVQHLKMRVRTGIVGMWVRLSSLEMNECDVPARSAACCWVSSSSYGLIWRYNPRRAPVALFNDRLRSKRIPTRWPRTQIIDPAPA